MDDGRDKGDFGRRVGIVWWEIDGEEPSAFCCFLGLPKEDGGSVWGGWLGTLLFD